LLVLTLWLVAILSMLAIAIARHLSLEVRLTKYRVAREQARALARSGIYMAMLRLEDDAEEPESDGGTYDWLGDDWALFTQEATEDTSESTSSVWTVAYPDQSSLSELAEAAAKATVRIQIVDESGKLRLNSATVQELLPIVVEETMAQAIVDAIDEQDPSEEDLGEGILDEGQAPYIPKNAALVVPEELMEIPGMTSSLYARLRAQTSPYNTNDPININTVSLEVLQAIGLKPETIQLIAQFREGVDGPDFHELDGIFKEAQLMILETLRDEEGVDLTGTDDGNALLSELFSVTTNVFTVTSEVVLKQPAARFRIEAVVRREGCEGEVPTCIVDWREG